MLLKNESLHKCRTRIALVSLDFEDKTNKLARHQYKPFGESRAHEKGERGHPWQKKEIKYEKK